MARLVNRGTSATRGWRKNLSLHVSREHVSPKCSSVKAVLQNQDTKGVKGRRSRTLEKENGDWGMKMLLNAGWGNLAAFTKMLNAHILWHSKYTSWTQPHRNSRVYKDMYVKMFTALLVTKGEKEVTLSVVKWLSNMWNILTARKRNSTQSSVTGKHCGSYNRSLGVKRA